LTGYGRSMTEFKDMRAKNNLNGLADDSIQFDDELSEIGGNNSMSHAKKKKKKKKKKKQALGTTN